MSGRKIARVRLKVVRVGHVVEVLRLVLGGHAVDAAAGAAYQAAEVVGALAVGAVAALVHLVLVRRHAGGVDPGTGELWIRLCLAAMVHEALLHAVVERALALSTRAPTQMGVVLHAAGLVVVEVILHVSVTLRHELVHAVLRYRSDVSVGRNRGRTRSRRRMNRTRRRRKSLFERRVPC